MSFLIGLGIVAGGIFLAENISAYNFVSDVARNGVWKGPSTFREGWRRATQTTQQQVTDYLDRAPEPIMSRFGYNLARKVYQV